MTKKNNNPELDALINRHFSPAQRDALQSRKWTDEDQAKANEIWAALFKEAEALCTTRDPASQEALSLARRWKAEAEKFTMGDPGLTASVGALYKEGFSTPEKAQTMPMSKEIWDFVQKAQAALKANETDDDTII